MKTEVENLIENYLSQDSIEQEKEYDDEIRAEADMCHECCSCCRFCCMMN